MKKHNRPTMITKVVRNPVGTFMIRTFQGISKKSMASHIERGKFWDACLKSSFDKYVRPGTVCIDAGANIGFYTVYMSTLVGEAGKVFAFEPIRYTYRQLCGNLFLNDCKNVEVHNLALNEFAVNMNIASRKNQVVPIDGGSTLLSNCCHTAGVALENSEDGSIQAVRLDDVMPIDADVSFVKVDVQGCDLLVMRGMMGLIARCRMPILFEYEPELSSNQNCEWSDYLAFFKEIGYSLTVVRERSEVDYLALPGEK